jgi:uncharacterized protein with ParB-like and HNH nuclease domain
MDVNFSKISLGDFLKNPTQQGAKTIKVPQFQRKYVWTKEAINDRSRKLYEHASTLWPHDA